MSQLYSETRREIDHLDMRLHASTFQAPLIPICQPFYSVFIKVPYVRRYYCLLPRDEKERSRGHPLLNTETKL